MRRGPAWCRGLRAAAPGAGGRAGGRGPALHGGNTEVRGGGGSAACVHVSGEYCAQSRFFLSEEERRSPYVRLSPAEAGAAMVDGAGGGGAAHGRSRKYVHHGFFQRFLPPRRFQVPYVGRLEQWNIFKRLAWRKQTAGCVLRKARRT